MNMYYSYSMQEKKSIVFIWKLVDHRRRQLDQGHEG